MQTLMRKPSKYVERAELNKVTSDLYLHQRLLHLMANGQKPDAIERWTDARYRGEKHEYQLWDGMGAEGGILVTIWTPDPKHGHQGKSIRVYWFDDGRPNEYAPVECRIAYDKLRNHRQSQYTTAAARAS